MYNMEIHTNTVQYVVGGKGLPFHLDFMQY